jgi:hypothetical protein
MGRQLFKKNQKLSILLKISKKRASIDTHSLDHPNKSANKIIPAVTEINTQTQKFS